MKRFFALLAFMLCWFVPAAQAALLSGHIGKAAVVMEFNDKNPAEVDGRYFYQQYHQDIALTGTLKNQQMTLYENVPYSEEPTNQPRLVLRRDGKNWQGQWIGKDGKALPVSLSPAQVPSPAAGEPALFGDLRHNDPYDLLRLNGLKLRQGKTEKFMGYSLQWLVEPTSGMRLFQVTSGYSPDALQRINRVLINRLWQSVSNYYECASGSARSSSPGADYDQTVTPRFFNAQVISVSEFTSYYCGGAHPDFGDSPINLEVATGRQLQLEDILWLGKGVPPKDDNAGRESLQTYRDKQLAPWLAKTFSRLYPKENDPDGCDYADASYWQYPNWYLTMKGVNISPSYPRAARACEYPDWSVLSYKLVNQHRGPAKIRLP